MSKINPEFQPLDNAVSNSFLPGCAFGAPLQYFYILGRYHKYARVGTYHIQTPE